MACLLLFSHSKTPRPSRPRGQNPHTHPHPHFRPLCRKLLPVDTLSLCDLLLLLEKRARVLAPTRKAIRQLMNFWGEKRESGVDAAPKHWQDVEPFGVCVHSMYRSFTHYDSSRQCMRGCLVIDVWCVSQRLISCCWRSYRSTLSSAG